MPEVNDIIWESAELSPISAFHSESHLNSTSARELANRLAILDRPLIVVGPQECREMGHALHELAELLQAPIIADPLSQLRSGPHSKKWVMDGYDAFLRAPSFIDQYKADGLIRFGPIPVSKPLLKYMESQTPAVHVVVNEGNRWSDPTHQVTDWVSANPVVLIRALIEIFKEKPQSELTEQSWSKAWLEVNAITKEATTTFVKKIDWFEGHAITDLFSKLPNKATVFASNSMPIRDLDSFFQTTDQLLLTLGNRGANGIDGITSTALGVATNKQPTFLIIGDLSFFHDTNGLMIGKHYGIDLTIIVVNNNGGGIFSFLPQSRATEHFEELFGTPLELDVADVAKMYKARHYRVLDRACFSNALQKASQEKGLKMIEFVTSRQENMECHRRYWDKLTEVLTEKLGVMAK